jgi:hypothetical protein
MRTSSLLWVNGGLAALWVPCVVQQCHKVALGHYLAALLAEHPRGPTGPHSWVLQGLA